jgi:hypothetical protein
MSDDNDEQALRRFIRKRRAILLAQAFLWGSCALGNYALGPSPPWLSLLSGALCVWFIWRAARYPIDLYNAWVEGEREQWKARAAFPFSRCPKCFWVSYNGNATHCADCRTALVRIPD